MILCAEPEGRSKAVIEKNKKRVELVERTVEVRWLWSTF